MNLKNQVSLQTESDIFYIFRIQKTRNENQNEYMSSTWHFRDKRFDNSIRRAIRKHVSKFKLY